MTLLWFDGFESYDDINDVISISNLTGSGLEFGTTFGRENRGMKINSWADYYIVGDLGLPSTLIAGIAFKAKTWITGDNNRMLFRIIGPDGTHISLAAKTGGTLEVRNSSGSVMGTTSGHTILINRWYYVELKVYIHDSDGTVDVKVNEVNVLSLTSQDTANGTATIDSLQIGEPQASGDTYYDDLYICDDAGSKNNDFLGDVRVDVVRPDGAGAHTDFSPSAGSNYENVDEEFGPDNDTTYNESQNAAIGEQDSYAMDSISVIGSTIHGVKDQITVRKTDAGHREVKIITRQGGSDYLGDAIVLSDSYITHNRIMADNPDDAAAFVEADITAGEVGVEVTV